LSALRNQRTSGPAATAATCWLLLLLLLLLIACSAALQLQASFTKEQASNRLQEVYSNVGRQLTETSREMAPTKRFSQTAAQTVA
jgi:hypothetical protein